MTTVDLVADLGEGFGSYRMGDDEALLDVLTSANLACGFHAGDPRIMNTTVASCVTRGVSVGAHPSFPDLVGFGRRAIEATPEEVRTDTLYQLGALHAFATAHGTRVRHLSPHGRLGNLVVTETAYAEALADAVQAFDPEIILLTQEGEQARIARERGLPLGIMAMADRAYRGDGTLVPRSQPGALVTDEEAVVERTVRMVTEGVVTSVDGNDVPVDCDTVLLHGDNAEAVTLARRLRAELERANVEIRPLPEVLAHKAGTA